MFKTVLKGLIAPLGYEYSSGEFLKKEIKKENDIQLQQFFINVDRHIQDHVWGKVKEDCLPLLSNRCAVAGLFYQTLCQSPNEPDILRQNAQASLKDLAWQGLKNSELLSCSIKNRSGILKKALEMGLTLEEINTRFDTHYFALDFTTEEQAEEGGNPPQKKVMDRVYIDRQKLSRCCLLDWMQVQEEKKFTIDQSSYQLDGKFLDLLPHLEGIDPSCEINPSHFPLFDALNHREGLRFFSKEISSHLQKYADQLGDPAAADPHLVENGLFNVFFNLVSGKTMSLHRDIISNFLLRFPLEKLFPQLKILSTKPSEQYTDNEQTLYSFFKLYGLITSDGELNVWNQLSSGPHFNEEIDFYLKHFNHNTTIQFNYCHLQNLPVLDEGQSFPALHDLTEKLNSYPSLYTKFYLNTDPSDQLPFSGLGPVIAFDEVSINFKRFRIDEEYNKECIKQLVNGLDHDVQNPIKTKKFELDADGLVKLPPRFFHVLTRFPNLNTLNLHKVWFVFPNSPREILPSIEEASLLFSPPPISESQIFANQKVDYLFIAHLLPHVKRLTITYNNSLEKKEMAALLSLPLLEVLHLKNFYGEENKDAEDLYVESGSSPSFMPTFSLAKIFVPKNSPLKKIILDANQPGYVPYKRDKISTCPPKGTLTDELFKEVQYFTFRHPDIEVEIAHLNELSWHIVKQKANKIGNFHDWDKREEIEQALAEKKRGLRTQTFSLCFKGSEITLDKN